MQPIIKVSPIRFCQERKKPNDLQELNRELAGRSVFIANGSIIF